MKEVSIQLPNLIFPQFSSQALKLLDKFWSGICSSFARYKKKDGNNGLFILNSADNMN